MCYNLSLFTRGCPYVLEHVSGRIASHDPRYLRRLPLPSAWCNDLNILLNIPIAFISLPEIDVGFSELLANPACLLFVFIYSPVEGHSRRVHLFPRYLTWQTIASGFYQGLARGARLVGLAGLKASETDVFALGYTLWRVLHHHHHQISTGLKRCRLLTLCLELMLHCLWLFVSHRGRKIKEVS